MTSDERIAEVLAAWQEARDDGHWQDPEEVIAAHPELADALRARFAALNVVEQAFAERRFIAGDAPHRIGEYEIVCEVGRGGMGVVYEAVQTSMDRRVALKVLFPSVTGSPRAVKRFQREAKAAGRLQHTNIVPVYTLGREGSTWFYAMELVEGSSLSALLTAMRAMGDMPGGRHLTMLTAHPDHSGSDAEDSTSDVESPPTPEDVNSAESLRSGRAYYERVAALFAGVADALEAAHEEGVVHRDVKPSNLILDVHGRLKLLDFGLARMADSPDGMTMTGELLGTPVYMSPEQARAKLSEIDHRTDLYSLGATLYEILTLRPPFRAASFADVYRQILTTEPAIPRSRNGEIPKDLETIVLKAMDKDRTRRYASADAMARDLRAFAEGNTIGARRVTAIEKAWRHVKRHKVRSGLAAALVIAALVTVLSVMGKAAEERRRRDLEYAALLEDAQRTASATYLAEATAKAVAARSRHQDDEARGHLDRAIASLPERPNAYYQRAMLASRDLEERLADLDRALERGFPERTIHLARALLLREGNRPKESEAEETEADLHPELSPLDLYLQARLHVLRKEWTKGLALLDRALSSTPAGSALRRDLLYHRARARVRLRDPVGAVEDIAALRRAGDDTLVSRLWNARIWHTLGRTEEAGATLAAVLEETTESGDEETWTTVCRSCPGPWGERATLAAVTALPNSATLWRYRSRALRSQRRPWRALAAAERALALAPEEAGNWQARSEVHASLGDAWKCFADMRRARDLEPDDRFVLAGYADALQALGRHTEALPIREALMERFPYDADLRFDYARELHKMKRPEEALESVEQALTLDPFAERILVHKAQLLGTLDRDEESESTLRFLLSLEGLSSWTLAEAARVTSMHDRHEEAVALAKRAVELAPGSAHPYYILGMLRGDMKEKEAAKAAHREALARNPRYRDSQLKLLDFALTEGGGETALTLLDGWTAERPDDPWLYKWRGLTLNDMRRYAEAATAFERAIELAPHDVNSRITLSRVFLFLNRFEDALASARDALEIAPDHAPLLTDVGGNLNNLGRYAEALPLLDRAIQVDPAYATAWAYRSFAHRRLGSEEKALADSAQAVEVDPTSATAAQHHAESLALAGRGEEALALLNRAVKASPDHAMLLTRRSALHFQAGRHAEAIDDAQHAAELVPHSMLVLSALSSALHSAGRTREALAVSERLVSLDQNRPELWYNHASLLVEVGELARAQDALERAIPLYLTTRDRSPSGRAALGNAFTQLALLHHGGGASDRAIAVLEEALEVVPDFFDVWGVLLNVQSDAGYPEAMLRVVAEARKRFPTDPEPLFWRGWALKMMGRIDDALASIAEGLTLAPDHVTGLEMRHRILWSQGKLEERVASFPALLAAHRALVNDNPAQPASHVQLADVFLNQAADLRTLERPSEAWPYLEEALTTIDEVLRQWPWQRPGTATAVAILGLTAAAHREEGRLDVAARLVERAFSLAWELWRERPDMQDYRSKLLALAEEEIRIAEATGSPERKRWAEGRLMELGLRVHDPDAAIRFLTKQFGLDGPHVAPCIKALLLRAAKRPAEAVNVARRTLDDDEIEVPPSWRAYLLAVIGETEAATEIVKAWDHTKDPSMWIARTAAILGDTDGAHAALAAAKKDGQPFSTDPIEPALRSIVE